MITKRIRIIALAVTFLLVVLTSLVACDGKKEEEEKTIDVFAAASLTDCMQDLGAKFSEKNPTIKVQFNFDSSGTLQTQIMEGAPCDVFVSAAQKQMNGLEEDGLIDKDTRFDLLVNKVVLIVPKGSDLGLTDFEGVADPKVERIALGDASVPVGQYAEEIFKHLNLWDSLQDKITFGNNVRIVLGYVESGDVSCGVVYKTDAAISDKVEIVAEAPADSHKPVIYPAAIVKDAKEKESGKLFLDFLKTDDAAAIFEKYGFTMAGK